MHDNTRGNQCLNVLLMFLFARTKNIVKHVNDITKLIFDELIDRNVTIYFVLIQLE